MPPNRDRSIPTSPAVVTRDEVTRLLDLQRKILLESIESLQRVQVAESKDLNTRLGELTKSLEFAHLEIDEMKNRMMSLTRENTKLHNTIHDLTLEFQQLKTDDSKVAFRLDYLDDQSRRNSLRFSGIPELRGENWEQSQELLTKVLRDKLSMEPQFERVHRVGKPTDKQPRDIVAKFTRFADRDAVLRDRRKFKGTKIYVNEDLCKGTQAARQQQMDNYYAARREGKVVYWNYRTLVTKPRPASNTQGPRTTNTLRQSPARSPREPHPSPRIPNLELPRPLHISQTERTSSHAPNNGWPSSPRTPRTPQTENMANRTIMEGACAMEEERSDVRHRRKPEFFQA